MINPNSAKEMINNPCSKSSMVPQAQANLMQ